MKKAEWADHVLPICQLITVNRYLKENCSYFTQHWKLKVHMSRKDGHGNNRLFYLQKTSLSCCVGGSYLVCTCDLGLIWTCWGSLKRTLPLVWACLPQDIEMQGRIFSSRSEVPLKANRELQCTGFPDSWNYSSLLSASCWHLSLSCCVNCCFLSRGKGTAVHRNRSIYLPWIKVPPNACCTLHL